MEVHVSPTNELQFHCQVQHQHRANGMLVYITFKIYKMFKKNSRVTGIFTSMDHGLILVNRRKKSVQWGVGPIGCRTNKVSDQWGVRILTLNPLSPARSILPCYRLNHNNYNDFISGWWKMQDFLMLIRHTTNINHFIHFNVRLRPNNPTITEYLIAKQFLKGPIEGQSSGALCLYNMHFIISTGASTLCWNLFIRTNFNRSLGHLWLTSYKQSY